MISRCPSPPPEQKDSPAWRALERWAAEQIEETRTLLENPDTTPEMTMYHRGVIAALKALVAGDEPRSKFHAPTSGVV